MTNPSPKPLPHLLLELEQAQQRRHTELLARLDALAVPAPVDPAPHQELLKRLEHLTALVTAPAEPVDFLRLEAGLDRMTEALGTLLARAELPDDLAATLAHLQAGAEAAQAHLAEARESRTAIRSGLIEIGGRVEDLLTLRDAVQGGSTAAVLKRLDALSTGLGIELGAADLAVPEPLSTGQDAAPAAAADGGAVAPETEVPTVPEEQPAQPAPETPKPTRKAKTAVQERDQ